MRTLLQNFTGDIKRQILRVEDTLYETQVERQKLLGIVHDKRALDIELKTTGTLPIPEIKRRLTWDVEKRGVIELALNPIVTPT